MKPLIVLLGTFTVGIFIVKVFTGVFDYAFAGRIALAVTLVVTSIGHFTYTKGMAMIVPAWIPFKREIVYMSGVFEAAAALFILIPSFQVITAWMLIVFFILVLPANILAAKNHVDYQKGTHSGPGPSYLWFPIPLQLLFILWTFVCAIDF